MDKKLQREIRVLKAYSLSLTVLLIVAVGGGFAWVKEKTKFDEIDVGRINIVEKDGSIKMVISNRETAPDAIIGGKTFQRGGGNSAGIIFYNDQGDECGGLTYRGQDRDGRKNASAVLLFDQLNQDQTVGIMYSESGGGRRAGLHVWDRSETKIAELMDKIEAIRAMKPGPEQTEALKNMQDSGEVGAHRMFVGKDQSKSAVVSLADGKGKPRLLLKVEADGTAKIEFLDENGKVTHTVPEE